jgi:hypothetical protein
MRGGTTSTGNFSGSVFFLSRSDRLHRNGFSFRVTDPFWKVVALIFGATTARGGDLHARRATLLGGESHTRDEPPHRGGSSREPMRLGARVHRLPERSVEDATRTRASDERRIAHYRMRPYAL